MPKSSEKVRGKGLLNLLRNSRVARSDTDQAVENFLSALDCPRSLAIWLMYRENEHNQIVNLEVNPLHYNNVNDFRDAYAASLYLSKSTFLKLDLNRKDVAIKKFLQYEELCKQTNYRFRNPGKDLLFRGPNVALYSIMQRKISQILGRFDPDEWLSSSGWGPGVTHLIKGELTSGVNKFQREVGITRDLYSLLQETGMFSAYPLWQEHLSSNEMFPTFSVGSITVTVPKTAKTDRVISIEPGLNLWFQKGLGSMIRRRLRNWGIDLNSQTRNQNLAKIGVLTNLATIDFSSASDSIAYELVAQLVPSDWLYALDSSRSHFGTLDNKTFRWEKFSSMGNGSTFELESLLFFAAARAVVEYVDGLNSAYDSISVFGDDVIIPSKYLELFSSFCDFLGFKINPDKSFSSGRFRESCGSHFFDGFDVKPIFLKDRLSNVYSIYRAANAIRRYSHRICNSMGCDIRFRKAFSHLYLLVPKPLRFRISEGYGDGGFIENLDYSAPAKCRYGLQGFICNNATLPAIMQVSEEIGMLLYRLFTNNDPPPKNGWLLLNPSKKAQNNNFALRGRTRKRIQRLYVPTWYDLGPWL